MGAYIPTALKDFAYEKGSYSQSTVNHCTMAEDLLTIIGKTYLQNLTNLLLQNIRSNS